MIAKWLFTLSYLSGGVRNTLLDIFIPKINL